MDREYYTELSVKYKYPDENGPRIITSRETAWDVDSEDMMNMFHTIMIGMTFSEEVFQDALKNYLEDNGYEVIKPKEKWEPTITEEE